MLDVLIAGHQNIEFLSGTPKKLAIFESCPASLLHRRDLVARNLSPEVPRKRLVKQYSHSQ